MNNQNLFRVECGVPQLADGSPKVLPVDNFPVSDKSFFNDNGFPSSELTILDRVSRAAVFDDDFVKKIASRLEALPEPAKTGLTLEQEIRALRPAWVQTPSEYAAYSERVYQLLSVDKAENVDMKKSAVAEKVDDVSSVSAPPSDSQPA